MMRVLLCALALTLAAPAWAQEEEPTAAPGSIAIGMIENANADGVFDIIHNGQVSVRHLGSGLRCDFERDGAGGRIVLYPGLPRGDDVACDYNDGREFITLYATRFPYRTTVEEQINGAIEAIRTRFPDAQGLPPSTPDAAGRTPPRRSSQFIVMRNGQRMYTYAGVAQVGDWIIKVRYSVFAADDAAARQGETNARALLDYTLSSMEAPPNL
jgi:hypothetical protein